MWPNRVSARRKGASISSSVLSSRTACANRGSFSSPRNLRDSVRDLSGSAADGVVLEVRRPPLGLRDDRARDGEHVARLEARPLRDQRGEVVAGADLGQPLHCVQFHSGECGERPQKRTVTASRNSRTLCTAPTGYYFPRLRTPRKPLARLAGLISLRSSLLSSLRCLRRQTGQARQPLSFPPMSATRPATAGGNEKGPAASGKTGAVSTRPKGARATSPSTGRRRGLSWWSRSFRCWVDGT